MVARSRPPSPSRRWCRRPRRPRRPRRAVATRGRAGRAATAGAARASRRAGRRRRARRTRPTTSTACPATSSTVRLDLGAAHPEELGTGTRRVRRSRRARPSPSSEHARPAADLHERRSVWAPVSSGDVRRWRGTRSRRRRPRRAACRPGAAGRRGTVLVATTAPRVVRPGEAVDRERRQSSGGAVTVDVERRARSARRRASPNLVAERVEQADPVVRREVRRAAAHHLRAFARSGRSPRASGSTRTIERQHAVVAQQHHRRGRRLAREARCSGRSIDVLAQLGWIVERADAVEHRSRCSTWARRATASSTRRPRAPRRRGAYPKKRPGPGISRSSAGRRRADGGARARTSR